MRPAFFLCAAVLGCVASLWLAPGATASSAQTDSLLEAQNTEIAELYGEGRYDEAAERTRAHMAAWAEAEGTDSAAWCSIATNLAPILDQTSDLAGAAEAHRLAVACTHRTRGGESEDMATVLNNYGRHLGVVGEFGRAELALEESLRLLRATLGEDHLYVAITLNNLAVNRQNQGNDHAAEPTMREAVVRLRAALGNEHRLTVTAINNLGRLLKDFGRLDEAESLLREALALRESVLGPDHQDTAISRRDLGRLLRLRGDLDAAESMLRRALADNERSLGHDHPDAAMSRHEIARVLHDRGDLDAAAALYDSTLALRRTQFEVGHSSRIALETERAEIDFERGDLVAAAARLERAAAEFEVGRERSGADYDRATYLASPWVALAGTRLMLGEHDAAWDALSRFQGRVIAEALAAEPLPDPDLGAREAMIGWLDVEFGGVDHAWGWVLRSDGPHWTELGGNDSEHIGALSAALSTPGSIRTVRDLARDVHRARLAPMLEGLHDVDEVIVVPSGRMVGIPIEALVDEQDAWLADRWTISYTPSPGIAAWLARRPSRGEGGALLVGDPPFQPRSDDIAYAPMPLSDDVIRGAVHGDTNLIHALPRLPGARAEVESIAAFWPERTTLLGPDASESTLDELARSDRLRAFRLLHFATHALVDSDDADAAALVLAQTDLPDAVTTLESRERVVDGVVTAREVVDTWRLDADLVTLSACNSARGRRIQGEGFVGFATAFLRAGARSTLASLWGVPDRATGLFMVAFHRAWVESGMTRADAVRAARTELRVARDPDGRRAHEHPYYWSSFVLLGDRR